MKPGSITDASLPLPNRSPGSRAEEPTSGQPSTADLKDQVTLSPEVVGDKDTEHAGSVSGAAKTEGSDKKTPDPRYTAQAILDRELLGPKKFYA